MNVSKRFTLLNFPEGTLFNRVNEVDPLRCPLCGGQMKIISFITYPRLIGQILEHLGLWVQESSRDPPSQEASHKNGEIVYEPFKPALNLIQ